MKTVKLKLGNETIYPILGSSQVISNDSKTLTKADVMEYIEEYFMNNLKPQISSSISSKYIMFQNYEDVSVVTIDIKANGYAYKQSKVNLYLNNSAKVCMKMFNKVTNEVKNVTLEKDPIVIQGSNGCLEDNQLIIMIYPNIVADISIRADIVNAEDDSVVESVKSFAKIGYLGEDIENTYLYKPFTKETVVSEIWNNHQDYISKINELVSMYNDIQLSMPYGAFKTFESEYSSLFYCFADCYGYVLYEEIASLKMSTLAILEGYIEDFTSKAQAKINELNELMEADEEAIYELENDVTKYESSLTSEELESKSSALQSLHESISEIEQALLVAQGGTEDTSKSVEYTFVYESKQEQITQLREQFESIK